MQAHIARRCCRSGVLHARVWLRNATGFPPRESRVSGQLVRAVPVREAEAARPQPSEAVQAWSLREDLSNALISLSISEPTEVQALAFPLIRSRQDVLIASHTGSGKTLAYLLPIIQDLKHEEDTEGFVGRPRRPRALVLSPTRELTDQISSVVKNLAHFCKIRSAALNTGMKPSVKRKLLSSCVDIVVATPTNLLEQMRQSHVAIGDVRFLVIDEADTMLDKGFSEQVGELLQALHRRGLPFSTVLVSASVGPPVKRLIAAEFPRMQPAETATLHKAIKGSNHVFVPMEAGRNKLEALYQVLSTARNERTMVFCNSIQSCRAVAHYLQEAGSAHVCFHGEMPIPSRKVAIRQFTEPGTLQTDDDVLASFVPKGPVEQPVLVCTDLAARGLDMPGRVQHVVNFDMPSTAVDYLHRSGRTARAGASGTITTLLQSAAERQLAYLIERAMKHGESLESLAVGAPRPDPRRAVKREKGSNHQRVKSRLKSGSRPGERSARTGTSMGRQATGTGKTRGQGAGVKGRTGRDSGISRGTRSGSVGSRGREQTGKGTGVTKGASEAGSGRGRASEAGSGRGRASEAGSGRGQGNRRGGNRGASRGRSGRRM